MIRYCYSEIQSFNETLMTFSASSFLRKHLFNKGNDNDGKTILMSRLDFNVKIIEVPKLDGEHLYDLLKFKIKSLYPGDPQSTVFDYQTISFKNVKYAVLFITKKEIAESYKRVGRHNLLILPFHLMKRFIVDCPDKDAHFVFLHKHWIEIVSVKDEKIFSSNAIKRSQSLKNDITKLKKITPHTDQPASYTIFCEKNEASFVEQQLSASLPDMKAEYIPFEEILKSPLSRRDSLFSKRKQYRIPPLKQRLIAYAAFLFIVGVFFLFRYSDHLYQYRDYLREINTSLTQRNRDISSVLKETNALEKRYKDLQAKKPVNIYLLLSELSKIFPSDTNMQSIVMRKNLFQIEGIALDPLRVEEKLKKNPLFKEIEISEIKPVPGSDKQNFKMRGQFADAKTQQ